MLVVSSFKFIPSKASITVNCACVIPADSGPVNYTLCGTLTRDWTVCFLARQAVATILFISLVIFTEHLHVVLVDVHVRHAPVANFHCVSVEDFSEGMVGWKVFGNYSQEFCSDIRLDTFRVGWVKICYVFRPFSTFSSCLGCGGCSVAKR